MWREKVKNLIKTLLIYIFIITSTNAQSLWLFDYGYNAQYKHLVENLSVDSLKGIILFDNIDQSPILYEAAAERLYYYYKETETQFLLNNLNTEIDITTPSWAIVFERSKIFTDAYILGLLGSPTAIDKMEIIANQDDNYYKLY